MWGCSPVLSPSPSPSSASSMSSQAAGAGLGWAGLVRARVQHLNESSFCFLFLSGDVMSVPCRPGRARHAAQAGGSLCFLQPAASPHSPLGRGRSAVTAAAPPGPAGRPAPRRPADTIQDTRYISHKFRIFLPEPRRRPRPGPAVMSLL